MTGGDKMKKHIVGVFQKFMVTGYWPDCSCGWRGKPKGTEEEALALADEHERKKS